MTAREYGTEKCKFPVGDGKKVSRIPPSNTCCGSLLTYLRIKSMFGARLLSQEKYEKRLTGTASRLVDGAYHGEAIKNAPHVVVGSCEVDRHLVTISQTVIYRLCKLFLNAPLINTFGAGVRSRVSPGPLLFNRHKAESRLCASRRSFPSVKVS